MTQTIGKCCFCNEDCNLFSQSCGKCVRSGRDSTLIIYYAGIGSDPDFLYTSENSFRKIIELNKTKFNKELPYNPLLCDLDILIEWTGAEIKEIN
jgi:hypothetical protein